MRLWLSKGSEVPLHEQLTTQLVLGIVSGDLAPDEHLPSTSQLARQFGVHPNTVRSAYRGLVRGGWLEWRRGSGFYVKPLHAGAGAAPGQELDRLISSFFQQARDRGYTLPDIQSRITRWLALRPPDHVVLIEPDDELRKILVAEIGNHVSMPVSGISVKECAASETLASACCVALYDSAKEVQAILPAEAPCLFMHSRSISKSLAAEMTPSKDRLITVVSRWPQFLQWARTTLIAAGIDPARIVLKDAKKGGWERKWVSRDFIITDSLMAGRLPKNCSARVFQIISDESIAELRTRIRQ